MTPNFFKGATALTPAQQDLFNSGLRIIDKEVDVFINSYKSVRAEKETYHSEALIGLWIAASEFNSGLGTDFICYARTRIKEQLKNLYYSFRMIVEVPEKKRGEVQFCSFSELGNQSNSNFMDDPEDDTVDADFCANLAEEEEQEQPENSVASAHLSQLLALLPKREQQLVKLVNGIGCPEHSMKEAADAIGVSKRQAERLYQRALTTMELGE